MSKQLLMGQEILVAPGMRGAFDNGSPYVQDERNDIRLDPNSFLDKVAIYEREVTGWFLEPAKLLISNDSFSNAFLTIMVCMSYIEGVEQYKVGESSINHSRTFFINSMNRIYPEQYDEGYLGELYNKTRCGLFHNGMIKGGVIFSSEFDNALEFQDDGDKILINPTKLLDDMINDFSSYVSQLRGDDNNSDVISLKNNFESMFSILPSE